MKTVVKFEGGREIEKALSELPKATGKNVLRRVGRNRLEPMADDAAARAPERTGKLAYSISVSEKATPRARWNKGKFRASRSTGIVMAMGPASGFGTLEYAAFDEFGTVDTPAFAYMRSAWDGGAMKALEGLKDDLWREIERASKRLARKQAKKT
jgi:hypothetical protein